MTLPAFADYTPERYRNEIEEAMAHQRDGLAALRDDPSPATLGTVLEAWEDARAPLNLILSAFYTVRSSDTTDEIDAIAEDFAPRLAAHSDAISLDRGLYERLKQLDARIAAGEVDADEQDRWHVSDLLEDFERAGVALADDDQERLRALNQRLAELGSQFQRLNREARNAATLHVTQEELAGLSPAEIASLADGDGFRVEVVNTTQQPIAAKLADAGLRRRLLDASLGRALGDHDTRAVLIETARVRAERATLLGFDTHAALVASEGTAKTTGAIEAMLIPLAQAALGKAREEAVELAAKYAELQPGAEFTAADWTYVEGLLRKERFDFDESELDEFLTVDRVVGAAYDAATDLYGITFRRREDLVGHTADSEVYEIADADGSPIGLFLMDLWARPTKNGGAWMTQLVEQSELTDDLPVVTNNCNFRQGVETVSWDDVITMFHEFGHALHGLFGRAKYPSRSGTAVPRDFVEFPSQVNEHWAWQPGRVLPAEWLDKLRAASEFGLGYAKAEALIAAVLDYAWHSTPLDELPTAVDDVAAFEAAALERHGLVDELVPPRYRSQYFAHIWGGGYAASYYGYTWAEVLDADAVAWFEENGGGTRANGDHFRSTLLGVGGGIDPMETYRRFRGRDPELQPLLKRLGLTI
ncbi:MAG: M3 family metallopeptidase [Propionibacterium sp.]|nr:M3 family metallopeptidase [Propionibacterium sp.]